MNKEPQITENQAVEYKLDPHKIDDRREKINEFMSKITLAQRESKDGTGDNWVETTAEIISYFNPRGLNGAPYYIHNGVMVCEYGKKEACIEKMEESTFEKMHGTEDGIVD